jgi:hypothetical protein
MYQISPDTLKYRHLTENLRYASGTNIFDNRPAENNPWDHQMGL